MSALSVHKERVFELLGYEPVRNHDGSRTEWGSIIGAPIEDPAREVPRETVPAWQRPQPVGVPY